MLSQFPVVLYLQEKKKQHCKQPCKLTAFSRWDPSVPTAVTEAFAQRMVHYHCVLHQRALHLPKATACALPYVCCPVFLGTALCCLQLQAWFEIIKFTRWAAPVHGYSSEENLWWILSTVQSLWRILWVHNFSKWFSWWNSLMYPLLSE